MPEDIQKLTRRRLGGILMAEGLVTPEQITEALEKQKETGELLGEILVNLGYITENNLVKILSMQFQFPFISPLNYEIPKEVLELVPVEMMYQHLFIPLDRFGNIVTLAMGGLLDEEVVQEVKKLTGCDVRIYIAPPSHVRKALQHLMPLEVGQKLPGKVAAKPAAGEKPGVVLEEMKPKRRPTTQIRKVAPPKHPEVLPPQIEPIEDTEDKDE
jgi:type IV pilus assembly protein PilB